MITIENNVDKYIVRVSEFKSLSEVSNKFIIFNTPFYNFK